MYRKILVAHDPAGGPSPALALGIALAAHDADVVIEPPARERDGLPTDHLRELAAADGAEVIVLGPRDRARPSHPTVQQLARDAPCAVAVAGELARGTFDRVDRVGVAYDGSAEAEEALQVGAQLAASDGVELVLLAVAEAGADVSRLWERVAAAATRTHADPRLLRGVPGPAIVAAAGDLSLLVAGSRRIGPPGRVAAGSVSGFLLVHAPIPVIVTPRPSTRMRTRHFARPSGIRQRGAAAVR